MWDNLPQCDGRKPETQSIESAWFAQAGNGRKSGNKICEKTSYIWKCGQLRHAAQLRLIVDIRRALICLPGRGTSWCVASFWNMQGFGKECTALIEVLPDGTFPTDASPLRLAPLRLNMSPRRLVPRRLGHWQYGIDGRGRGMPDIPMKTEAQGDLPSAIPDAMRRTATMGRQYAFPRSSAMARGRAMDFGPYEKPGCETKHAQAAGIKSAHG